MMMKRLVLALACLSLAACSKKDKPKQETEAPAGSASGSATATAGKPATPAAAKLDGTKVTPVPCQIANLGTEFKRSLHVDSQGTIYVFDDGRKPHVIKAGSGPCGLAYAETMADGDYAFAADGKVIAAPEDGGECASQKFATFSWTGTVANGRAFALRDNGHELQVEDLAAKPCSTGAFSATLPEDGRIADIAANADVVLLVNFIASGNDGNAIWRYKPDGTLVDKVGLKPEGGSLVGWIDEVSTCADGVCALESGKLVVFDTSGKLVGKHPIKGEWSDVVDLVEVGGALYALVTSKDKNADLLRLDGVYAK